MSEFGDHNVDKLDIFEDRVDSMLVEIVAYVRNFLQAEVDVYNKSLKSGQPPKCVICELEDFMEELSNRITGTTHVANETHDAFHEILYKQFGYESNEGI